MGVPFQITRQIVDAEGILDNTQGIRIAVRFDLTETQAAPAGLPGSWFAYGDLRPNPGQSKGARTRLEECQDVRLRGKSFEACIHLNGNRFTVVKIEWKQAHHGAAKDAAA